MEEKLLDKGAESGEKGVRKERPVVIVLEQILRVAFIWYSFLLVIVLC